MALVGGGDAGARLGAENWGGLGALDYWGALGGDIHAFTVGTTESGVYWAGHFGLTDGGVTNTFTIGTDDGFVCGAAD